MEPMSMKETSAFTLMWHVFQCIGLDRNTKVKTAFIWNQAFYSQSFM